MGPEFTSVDLIGLQGLITDEDIDLVPLSYSEDEQMVSFDVMLVKRDHPTIEMAKKRILTVYPIVRRTVRFHNVVHFESRISRGTKVKLRCVSVYCGIQGRIEITGGGGRLVITVSELRIEVGPESETEYELVDRKLWRTFGFARWRLRRTGIEREKDG